LAFSQFLIDSGQTIISGKQFKMQEIFVQILDLKLKFAGV